MGSKPCDVIADHREVPRDPNARPGVYDPPSHRVEIVFRSLDGDEPLATVEADLYALSPESVQSWAMDAAIAIRLLDEEARGAATAGLKMARTDARSAAGSQTASV